VKALVLGANGFLGAYLGFALPRLGWETAGVARRAVDFSPQLSVVTQVEDYQAFITQAEVDLVINAVAMASHEACEANPDAARAINALLPEKWAVAAGATGARIVHISTDAVFDGNTGAPFSEQDAPAPRSVYGLSKREGEQRVLEANPEAIVLRTNFFGWSPDRATGILDFFETSFRTGKAITGFSDYTVSSLYVGHLVEALTGVVHAGGAGIFHAVASDALSKYDFGLAVADVFGLDPSTMAEGSLEQAHHLVARGRDLSLSTATIEALLGRTMPGSHQGLLMAKAEREAVMDYFGAGASRKATL